MNWLNKTSKEYTLLEQAKDEVDYVLDSLHADDVAKATKGVQLLKHMLETLINKSQ